MNNGTYFMARSKQDKKLFDVYMYSNTEDGDITAIEVPEHKSLTFDEASAVVCTLNNETNETNEEIAEA